MRITNKALIYKSTLLLSLMVLGVAEQVRANSNTPHQKVMTQLSQLINLANISEGQKPNQENIANMESRLRDLIGYLNDQLPNQEDITYSKQELQKRINDLNDPQKNPKQIFTFIGKDLQALLELLEGLRRKEKQPDFVPTQDRYPSSVKQTGGSTGHVNGRNVSIENGMEHMKERIKGLQDKVDRVNVLDGRIEGLQDQMLTHKDLIVMVYLPVFTIFLTLAVILYPLYRDLGRLEKSSRPDT